MNRKFLIKLLELLNETYPEVYHAGKLTKKLNVSLDGEFFKTIKYLEESKKIDVRRIGQDPSPNQRERLQLNDEIKINTKGINLLNDIKLIEANEKRNNIMICVTIFMMIATISLAVSSYYSVIPIITYTASYRCPHSFSKSDVLSLELPLENVGHKATSVTPVLKGNNIETFGREPSFTLVPLQITNFHFNLKINNESLDRADFYFMIRYKSLLFTKTRKIERHCFYEKDEKGDFILEKE